MRAAAKSEQKKALGGSLSSKKRKQSGKSKKPGKMVLLSPFAHPLAPSPDAAQQGQVLALLGESKAEAKHARLAMCFGVNAVSRALERDSPGLRVCVVACQEVDPALVAHIVALCQVKQCPLVQLGARTDELGKAVGLRSCIACGINGKNAHPSTNSTSSSSTSSLPACVEQLAAIGTIPDCAWLRPFVLPSSSCSPTTQAHTHTHSLDPELVPMRVRQVKRKINK
jgi:ribosomal protein L7Ae-like RNA K-turn-binding protein